MSQNPQAPLGLGALMHPAIHADPYPFYHRLRETDPVFRDEPMRMWVVSRHADVAAILRDPRFLAARMRPDPDAVEASGLERFLPLFDFIAKQMLFSDPPDHTRLRRLVNKAFTPRVVEGMRGQIQQLVDDILDAVEPTGRMDAIADLAYPLPTTVIAQMLGVPPGERAQFKAWSDDFAVFLGEFEPTPEQMARALKTVHEISAYFRERIADLRRNPRDTLLGAMAIAEEAGDRLTEDELLSNALLLLAAGHETTTNLIGNGLLTLLRHPDQMDRLHANPARIDGTIEEILRFASPVQLTSRLVAEDLEFQGRQIWHNQLVVVLLGAANRDPAQFPDPDRFDISRADNRHVSFGLGPHFCLGAPLARLEGQIAIGSVVRRFPKLRLDVTRVEWHPSPVFRGLRALPVAF